MKNSGNTKHSMKIVWSLEEKSLKDNINEWQRSIKTYKISGKLSQEKIIKLVIDNYDGALLYSFKQIANHTLLQSK
jgi:hypothetical protein